MLIFHYIWYAYFLRSKMNPKIWKNFLKNIFPKCAIISCGISIDAEFHNQFNDKMKSKRSIFIKLGKKFKQFFVHFKNESFVHQMGFYSTPPLVRVDLFRYEISDRLQHYSKSKVWQSGTRRPCRGHSTPGFSYILRQINQYKLYCGFKSRHCINSKVML